MNQTGVIALDFEGVCANSMAVMDEFMQVDLAEHNNSWGFEPEVWEQFDLAGDIVFQNHSERIEPYEENIGELVGLLRESHEVKILTNRYGHDEAIKQWMVDHGVESDGFESNPEGTDKSAFEKKSTQPDGFTAFIDDNPTLAYSVDLLFLVDQPWNRHIDADDKTVIRVGDGGVGAIGDVLNEMYEGPCRE
jgi:hypothetical protein